MLGGGRGDQGSVTGAVGDGGRGREGVGMTGFLPTRVPWRSIRTGRRGCRGGLAGVVTVLPVVVLLAACSSPGPAHRPTAAAASPLTVTFSPSGPITDDLNPFSTTSGLVSLGATSLLYEPLLQFDPVRPSTVYDWLASGYRWSDGGKTLTFTLRSDVRWSDGLAFTSADVAFTFDLLYRFPALDSTGIQIQSVRAPNPTTVVLTFADPGYTQFPAIASVPIVSHVLWKNVNPVTYTNPDPVGTGPYLLSSATPEGLIFKRNPRYWQAGLPKVPEVHFEVFDSDASANLALESGQVQWTGNYIPDVQTQFVKRDPAHNVNWSPSDGEAFLLTDDARYPYNLTAVRQAISEALNRPAIMATGELGEVPPATSPTGLALPLFKSFLAPEYAHLTFKPDPAAASRLLAGAGFTRNSAGTLLEPDGHPFDITMVAPSGWTDTLADYQVIAEELRPLGIDATVDPVALTEYIVDLTEGEFDMAVLPATGQPNTSPYYTYQYLLGGSHYEPVGKLALGDFERWDNTQTNALLNAYANTTAPATRQLALDLLEKIMVDDVPVIPFAGAVAWGQYETNSYVGWPSPTDPYEVATPSSPTDEVVLLHLRPR